MLIVAKEDQKREDFEADSFYPIGLKATITEVSPNGYLLLRTGNRVNLDDVAVYRDHTIDLSLSRRSDIDDLDPEEARKKLRAVKAAMLQFAEGFQWGQAARGFVAQWESIGEAAVLMSPWMLNSNAERYADNKRMHDAAIQKYSKVDFEQINAGIDAAFARDGVMNYVIRNSEIGNDPEFLALMLWYGQHKPTNTQPAGGGGGGGTTGQAAGFNGIAKAWD